MKIFKCKEKLISTFKIILNYNNGISDEKVIKIISRINNRKLLLKIISAEVCNTF